MLAAAPVASWRLNEDDYAYDKFQAFRDMEKSVRVLGTLFDRLLQEYAETAVRR